MTILLILLIAVANVIATGHLIRGLRHASRAIGDLTAMNAILARRVADLERAGRP